jgi:hypothetical protein
LAKRLARFGDFPQLTADRRLIAWKFLAEYPLNLPAPELSIFVTGLTDTNHFVRSAASAALHRSFAQGMKVERDVAFRVLFPLSSSHMSAQQSDLTGSRPGTPYAWHMHNEGIAEALRNLLNGLDPKREVIPLYTLEMGHIPARVGAANELARNPRMPERTVPLLIANLTSTNRAVIEGCAVALGAYGSAAESAVPHLEKLLEHPRERIRVASSNALESINRRVK